MCRAMILSSPSRNQHRCSYSGSREMQAQGIPSACSGSEPLRGQPKHFLDFISLAKFSQTSVTSWRAAGQIARRCEVLLEPGLRFRVDEWDDRDFASDRGGS